MRAAEGAAGNESSVITTHIAGTDAASRSGRLPAFQPVSFHCPLPLVKGDSGIEIYTARSRPPIGGSAAISQILTCPL
jgi:hypothetical protein